MSVQHTLYSSKATTSPSHQVSPTDFRQLVSTRSTSPHPHTTHLERACTHLAPSSRSQQHRSLRQWPTNRPNLVTQRTRKRIRNSPTLVIQMSVRQNERQLHSNVFHSPAIEQIVSIVFVRGCQRMSLVLKLRLGLPTTRRLRFSVKPEASSATTLSTVGAQKSTVSM